MRKYESIWLKVKLEGECTIVANPALHSRIKKALTKEKGRDTTYKVQWDIVGSLQPVFSITNPLDSKGNPIKNALLIRLVKPTLLKDL